MPIFMRNGDGNFRIPIPPVHEKNVFLILGIRYLLKKKPN